MNGVGSDLWNCRPRHMSVKGIQVMLAKGKFQDLRCVNLEFCENCIFGKQQRVNFKREGNLPKSRKLELVHTDVLGPIEVHFLGNGWYFVTFIDDAIWKV